MTVPDTWPTAQDWSDTDERLGLPSDTEIRELARAVDRARSGLRDRKVSPREIQAREVGFFGVRAVCRYLGVGGTFSVYQDRGSRRTSLYTYSGMPVGVVTRHPLAKNTMPDLILRVAETPRDDLALVLVVWKGEAWEPIIPGWACEGTLRRNGRIEVFRNNEQNFVLGARLLRPMTTLPFAIPCADIEREHRQRLEQATMFGGT